MADACRLNAGVKQGYILSTLLFPLAIERLMWNITKEQKQGIQWYLTTNALEELDYGDDLGLLVQRFQDINQKVQI